MPPRTVTLDEIQGILPSLDLVPIIERGFAAYSAGESVVPPVGELILDKGEVHIKYGYIRNQAYYVIKIASGFYGNPSLGLPSGNGIMLLFSQQTGELTSILLDEGHLTDVRTAVAGAVVAKHLAPQRIDRIGIVGTGTQARLQLQYLSTVTSCRDVLVWGRGEKQLARYCADVAQFGFHAQATYRAAEILQNCNLVVTATPATEPLLYAADLRAGTHITAVGSDTPAKQELDAAILARADLVMADSIAQCRSRGEIHQAVKRGAITEAAVVELGEIILGNRPGRSSDSQITVADLTGVAVQDIEIATAVHERLAQSLDCC
jgi:ornithine cyclodeaminase